MVYRGNDKTLKMIDSIIKMIEMKNETNEEKVKRIKEFIKRDQPKVSGDHFDWSQFKDKKQYDDVKRLVYDKETKSYIIHEDEK